MTPPPDVLARLRALPLGQSRAQLGTATWLLTKSTSTRDRAVKLVAEELGGPGYLSLNLYELSAGPRLFPCERPMAEALALLRALLPAP